MLLADGGGMEINMKKNFLSVILTACIVIGRFTGCTYNNETISEATKNKSNINGGSVGISGVPTFLTFDTDSYYIHNKEEAIEAIQDISEGYGLKEMNVDLEECKENKFLDSISYFFSQKYKDIPVYGRKIIVCTDLDGQLRNMTNNYLVLDDINLTEQVSEKEARKIVEERYEGEVHICNDGKTIYSLYGTEPILAWQFYVNGSAVSETCIVDAYSGKVLATFSDIFTETGLYEDGNGTISFNTKKMDDGTYRLIDENRNIYVYDSQNQITNYAMVDQSGNIYYYNTAEDKWYNGLGDEVMTIFLESIGKWDITDITGLVIGENAEQIIYTNDVYNPLEVLSNDSTLWKNEKAARALSLVGNTYDFFGSVLERNGYDDNNGLTYIYVNDGWDNGKNAYSHLGENKPPTILAIGYKQEITADLIGHEYMHSVERTISSMIYKNESGALTEAIADVFGELTEDWVYDGKLDDDCDWIHGTRNMIHPSQDSTAYCYYARNGLECPVYKKYGEHIPGEELKKPGIFSKGCCEINIPYPDTYQGENYWTGSDDYGGTHVNSTVISHACYLMTHPQNGTGLTNEELAKLLYKTLGDLLPDCNFRTFATTLRNIAVDMGMDEEKVKTIETTFSNIGIDYDDALIVKLQKEIIEINSYLENYEPLVNQLNMKPTDCWQFPNSNSYVIDGFYLEWINGLYSMKNEGASYVKLYNISLGDAMSQAESVLLQNGWKPIKIKGNEHSYILRVNDKEYFLTLYLNENSDISSWYLSNWTENELIELDNYINSFEKMVAEIGGNSTDETGDHENWIIKDDALQYGNYYNSSSVDEIIITSNIYSVYGIHLNQNLLEVKNTLLLQNWNIITENSNHIKFKHDNINLALNLENQNVSSITFWRSIKTSDEKTSDSFQNETDIGQDGAIQMAREKFGDSFSYICSASFEYNGTKYYVVDVKAKVDNHYSRMTQVLVAADGSSAKEGYYNEGGQPEFYE